MSTANARKRCTYLLVHRHIPVQLAKRKLELTTWTKFITVNSKNFSMLTETAKATKSTCNSSCRKNGHCWIQRAGNTKHWKLTCRNWYGCGYRRNSVPKISP